MDQLLKRLRYTFRTAVGSHAALYPLLATVPTFRHRIVVASTDLCIEGFPRSANTFTLHAFEVWNPGMAVAHHLHVPMQVIRSVRMGIPCLVLIRSPKDALASTLVADTRLPARVAVASYLSFYRRIWEYRQGFVVGDFATATARPDLLIERLNERFGTRFRRGSCDESLRAEVYNRIRRHHHSIGQTDTLLAIPSEQKRALKQQALDQLATVPSMREANEVYNRFLQLAGP